LDFSVIVPLYNVEKYVDRCISALQDQDYPKDRYEIIVVDNNSTDATRPLVRGYPRACLLKEPIQGAYVARNRGISTAKGDVIAFTDPDCLPCPDWLLRVAEAMGKGRTEIVLGKREYSSSSFGLSLLSDYESSLAEHVFFSDLGEIYFGYTNNMAVRASLFEKLGRFMPQKRGADTVFMQKAVDEFGCDIVAFCPDMRVSHLEIGGVSDFYKKQFVYGRSNEASRRSSSFRSLSQAERLGIFMKTVHKRNYSLARATGLFALLGGGLFFYESGRLGAQLKRAGSARMFSILQV
jgi:glycosyltransferase involved in cell wall biosynthesis